MNIFVLEDQWIEQQYLKKVLERISTRLHLTSFNITIWSSAEELVTNLPTPSVQNVYLLDLEINGDKKAGLKLSQLIRQNDILATIIFITVHDEFLPTTYSYRTEALDFIAKDQDNIEERLSKDFQFVVEKSIMVPSHG